MDVHEPPPILNEIEDELKKYLLSPECLPIHQYERNQQFWEREANPKLLLYSEGSPITSTLKVQRDVDTGEIIDFKEVMLQSAGATAKNSMSFNREPAPSNESVRGNATHMPFWPGSFPKPQSTAPKVNITSELLTIPPGFPRGLVFDEDGFTVLNREGITDEKKTIPETKNIINLLELVQQEQDLLGFFNESSEIQLNHDTNSKNISTTENIPDEEEILTKFSDLPVLNISKTPTNYSLKNTEWAVLLDTSVPVTNFREKIPDMAYNFDFELDTFQKLAILELEKHNHVFVAAPTSAGKTVVAQYAIALSQKHCTRTIYTSPIKALSNQKYRDFKKDFGDVGLITGDFQVNQTASCLIMTTEILRSMLYCGSEVTRALEYVIFDEVHYVNDPERGHVWEQVLILLPANVCVVLLSATVPNSIEFADWLGRTHKRKVYVVSTEQRPVPLQHFLYVSHRGDVNKHKKHLLLDANQWRSENYYAAKNDVDTFNSTGKQTYRGNVPFNPTEEKRMWTGVMAHLRKNDLLPVVVFTFSRQKCDKVATNLSSLLHFDFTTENEKIEVEKQFNKYISCLKQCDRNIPQIKNMKKLLCKGIGVHHSGILPIIKEIIEMMFQEGRIKLLFATETFAMGVNMPARTVIFESWKKHDGKELRNLQPAEYIQMAGRAGRRSHDTKGTVMILCKSELPTQDVLKQMMQGRPSSLVSQFRLTYGMVLSLLRVESLSVEGMMSRSFQEADHQKKMVSFQKEINELECKLDELNEEKLTGYLQPLVEYFYYANDYLEKREDIMNKLIAHPKVQKLLVPGRLLVITKEHHINKLAMVLVVLRSKELAFKVLILTNSSNNNESLKKQEDLWYQMLALASEKLFVPEGSPGHEIIRVKPTDIFEISGKVIKLDPTLIINDYDQRQMSRFRDNPPGPTCTQAVQELQKHTILANEGSISLDYQHFIDDLKINEKEFYFELTGYYELKNRLDDYLPSTKIPNFEVHLLKVFERKILEKKLMNLQFHMSDKSLSLYPDLKNKINLLRHLGYVDNENTVELKGKVACEMGMSELLITELVLRNILTKLKPAEVAALLSPLVFQKKARNEKLDETHLTKDLIKGVKEIEAIHEEIAERERFYGIQTYEIQEDLNFGLTRVVYEWASDMPFAEIMKLTDIQEGIIVRCIQQLNETICDVKKAARIIGDSELQTKMEQASTAIKRDIVFAASLYTHEA